MKKSEHYRNLCPKADASFVMRCVDEQLTDEQCIAEYTVSLERQLDRPVGVDGLEEIGGAAGADAGEIDELIRAEMERNPRLQRHQAHLRVMRANPELRAALVEAANYGRR